jgi:DNA-binding LacI/PurR family transcriptional regulator/signal transduction histidine kinase
MTPAPRERPTIGLLVNRLGDGFEEALWRNMTEAAAAAGADLFCFVSGVLSFDTPNSGLIDLLDPRTLDGLVVVAGSVGWLSGAPRVADPIRRLGPLPTVTLSEQVAGTTSLLVDNAAGITAALEHLARDHGCRRVAFVRGPASNADASARLDAFRAALAGVGLPWDPALVVGGDFERASGMAAVRELLARGVAFDALLASNDVMALGAMDELRRLGRAVPRDVAVVGFDDLADAASLGLTTIRQPLPEMGREAVRLLLARVRGEAVSEVLRFPARPVIRSSCGCGDVGARSWRPAPSLAACETPAALAAALERQFADLGARIGAPGWAQELARAALTETPEADHPFLRACAALLDRGLRRTSEPRDWFRLVRAALEPQRHRPGDAGARAAALSETAHELVGTRAAAEELDRRTRTDEETRVLRRLIEPMPLPDETLKENLTASLPALGMRSFFLSRFSGPDRREAELLVHFDLDGAVALEDHPLRFPSWRLVPGRLGGGPRSFVVLPVHSPVELLGYAVCEVGPMNPSGYELLMHEISTVLGVNLLMGELSEQHRQLVETARQAGMAEVAVGALHNIGNLLVSVGASAEQIQTAAAAAQRALPARPPGSPTAPDAAEVALAQAVESIRGQATALLQNTGLIRESIRALQDHARGGRDPLQRERFELADVVRAALEIQRPHLERHGVQVRQQLARVPPLVAPRSRLVHVIVNLLKNAAEAMRETPPGQRRITLRAGLREDGRVALEVRDTGPGILADQLPRIFSYGFTTKPDGHGFGLHTCAAYLKQMGGEIAVRSDGPDPGAAFTVVLPAGGAEGAG